MSKDRIVGEHYVEMTWTCTSCRIVNLGRSMRCESCHSPKENDEQDRGLGSVVTDPALLAKATAGPNRVCPYCGAQIRNLDEKCGECAAERLTPGSRESLRSAIRQGVQEGAQPLRDFARDVERFSKSAIRAKAKIYGASGERDGERSRSTVPYILISLLGAAAIAIGTIWLFSPHRTTATVTSASWSITRNVRTKTLMHDSGWGSPSGAFNTSCRPMYYTDQDCNPHDCNFRQESYQCRPHDCRCRTYQTTQNLKNGFARVTTHERCDTCYDQCSRRVHDTCYDRCPVYRQWCEYDYYAWPVTQTASTAGHGQDVREPALEAGVDQKLEQAETFSVTLGHKGKTWELQPGRVEYMRYALGSAWEIEVNRAGMFKVIGEKR